MTDTDIGIVDQAWLEADRRIKNTATVRQRHASKRINDALATYQKLIYGEIHRFQRYRGGDWEELKDEAYTAFTRAYRRYQVRGDRPNTGKWHIGGWLRFCIQHQFKDWDRNRQRLAGRRIVETDLLGGASDIGGDGDGNPLALRSVADHRAGRFSICNLASEVSDDARRALEIAVKINGRGPSTKRHRLIAALQDLGWAGQRIIETFKEIKEALGA